MKDQNKKKVFITGGAGFIGSHTTNLFLDNGYEVAVYDNFSNGKRSFLKKTDTLHIIKGDIRDSKKLRSSIQDFNPHIIIHLAAIHFIPYCDAHPDEAVEINITGTHNLLSIIEHDDLARLKKVIIMSSAAVYAPSPYLHKESEVPGPVDIYGITKANNELQLKALYQKKGICSVAVRLFNVYGPNETNPHLIPEILAQIKKGERFLRIGNADTKRSFIHAKDTAAGLLSLATLEKVKGHTIVNLGSKYEYTAREIIKILSELLGEKISFSSTPQKKRKIDRKRLHPDLTLIQKQTNWKETYDMKKGLAELMKEHKLT